MKKTIFYLLAIFIIATACEKNEQAKKTDNTDKKITEAVIDTTKATPDETPVAEVVDTTGTTPDETPVAEVVDSTGTTPDETPVAEVVDSTGTTPDETPVTENPKITLGMKDFSHSECKSNALKSTKKEYFEFKVDGNFLNVLHINSIFNCCPGELLANSTINNDTIIINEDETEHYCDCVCKYDLKYKLGPLEYGKYHIVYKKMNSTFSEFNLDFNSNTNEIINIKHKYKLP